MFGFVVAGIWLVRDWVRVVGNAEGYLAMMKWRCLLDAGS